MPTLTGKGPRNDQHGVLAPQFKRRLFVFSGLDGAGKSTQIQLLKERVETANGKCVVLWTRGGYTSGINLLKSFLRSFSGKRLPPPGRSESRSKAFTNRRTRRIWLTIAILDLIRIYGFQIRFWKLTGKTVICDRYWPDTLLDFRFNFPAEKITNWWLWKLCVWVSPKPDNAFMLLIPVKESQRRGKLKQEPFADAAEVLEKRLNDYRTLTSLLDYSEIECCRSIEEIQDTILAQADE